MVIDMGKRIVRKVFCVVLILALLAGAELLWSNYTISVSDYEVRSEKISAPIRVVFLSDLHGKSFGKDNRRLTEKITAQEPDVIALVGDFFNSDADADEIDAMCSLIRQCVQIAPTYFSMGNHEAAYLKTDAADLRARIADAGAVIADNQYFDVSINGNDVRLGGYMGYYYQPHMMVKDPAQQRFEREFTKDFEDTDRYKLLFNHIPTSWLDWEYRNTHDVDLVLTGHYHGGIVRIPLIEQGLFAPYVGKFPPYTKGMYVGEKATCIITTGLAGSYGIPRFFNPPEICTVDILPAE